MKTSNFPSLSITHGVLEKKPTSLQEKMTTKTWPIPNKAGMKMLQKIFNLNAKQKKTNKKQHKKPNKKNITFLYAEF